MNISSPLPKCMPYIDISRGLKNGFPVWPGDVPFHWTSSSVPVGDHVCQTSSIALSSHSGTHVDAPAHLSPQPQEATTLERLDLSVLIGPARVLDLRGQSMIDASLIHTLSDCPLRLLLHTDNSHRPYQMEDFVALTAEAAMSVVSRACLLVGIDGPSVDLADSPDLPVHRTLLDAGVVIIEGLDLSRVGPGDYELICLPLSVPGSEGAPARVVLRELA